MENEYTVAKSVSKAKGKKIVYYELKYGIDLQKALEKVYKYEHGDNYATGHKNGYIEAMEEAYTYCGNRVEEVAIDQ